MLLLLLLLLLCLTVVECVLLLRYVCLDFYHIAAATADSVLRLVASCNGEIRNWPSSRRNKDCVGSLMVAVLSTMTSYRIKYGARVRDENTAHSSTTMFTIQHTASLLEPSGCISNMCGKHILIYRKRLCSSVLRRERSGKARRRWLMSVSVLINCRSSVKSLSRRYLRSTSLGVYTSTASNNVCSACVSQTVWLPSTRLLFVLWFSIELYLCDEFCYIETSVLCVHSSYVIWLSSLFWLFVLLLLAIVCLSFISLFVIILSGRELTTIFDIDSLLLLLQVTYAYSLASLFVNYYNLLVTCSSTFVPLKINFFLLLLLLPLLLLLLLQWGW